MKRLGRAILLFSLSSVIALTFIGCGSSEEPAKDSIVGSAHAVNSVPSADNAIALGITDNMPDEAFSGSYNVTFIVGTTRLETQQVLAGGSATYPRSVPTEEGFIFRAWDAPLTDIKSDVLIRAELIDVNGMENVFSLASTYADQYGEATVVLRLGGNVDLCAFDISVVYPKEDISFVDFDDVDDDVTVSVSELEGVLHLNFSQVANIKGGFDICSLVFTRISSSDATEMPITFSHIEAVSASANDILPAKYNAVDAIVFFN